jgi:hypothetical protein
MGKNTTKMGTYKQRVLEYTGSTISTENREGEYTCTFEKVRTADDFYIYVDIDHGEWANVVPDMDIMTSPDALKSRILENIDIGGDIYVDSEILIACDLKDEYSETWENLYNHEIEKINNKKRLENG